jgi:radical SAM superfamily enzyme YgiQ (UPF0313 family)
VKVLIVDCLASGKGTRIASKDVIGSGPRTIAGILEKFNFKTKIMQVENILNKNISLNQYNLLLISGMTNDIPSIYKVTKIWQNKKSNPVVIGGPAASEPVRVLLRTKADISVTGEGEVTISHLLKTELSKGTMPKPHVLQKIKGIAYRTGNEVEVNSLRPVQSKEVLYSFTASTSKITDYPLFYAARVYVEVVRGCSNFHRTRIGPIGKTCTYCEICTKSNLGERYYCPVGIPPGCGYCSVPSLYGPPRSKPVFIVKQEVKELLDLGVSRIVLSAPGFLDYGRDLLVEPEPLTDPRKPEPNYNVLEELLQELTSLPIIIEEKASLMIENIKAVLVTERASRILGKYLHGTPVNIGLETGDPEHSYLLGRPDTPSESLKAIKRLKKVGLNPYVYFIHGLPGQSEATVEATIKIINKIADIGVNRIILYRFQKLPMSAFNECPSGPPSVLNIHSKRIFDAVKKVNELSKKNLVGKKIKVIIAEQYNRDLNYLVSYPINHGPVVLIKGEKELVGKILDVKIKGVASDRIIIGDIHLS